MILFDDPGAVPPRLTNDTQQRRASSRLKSPHRRLDMTQRKDDCGRAPCQSADLLFFRPRRAIWTGTASRFATIGQRAIWIRSYNPERKWQIRNSGGFCFGGFEMRVPENWIVANEVMGIFGGTSDETRQPLPEAPGVKNLIVTGTAVFGGVSIKN